MYASADQDTLASAANSTRELMDGEKKAREGYAPHFWNQNPPEDCCLVFTLTVMTSVFFFFFFPTES